MAVELDTAQSRLAALLFLLLDSWILREPSLFSDTELQGSGLSRTSTYQSVRSRDTYQTLQDLLLRKASAMSHGRYKRTGRNLYELHLATSGPTQRVVPRGKASQAQARTQGKGV